VLPDWLAHRAATTPERVALIARGGAWSFAELDAAVTVLAVTLRSHGVREGDHVATLLSNGAAPAMLVHAVLRTGGVIVPLNARLADAEVAWQLRDSGARLLVVDASTATRAEGEVCGLGVAMLRIDEPGALPPARDGDVDRTEAARGLRLAHDPEAILAIIYTSGTTGRPKGAMLTVGNFWWSAVGSALNLGTHADDRWLACLPLFHVGGLSIVLRAAIYGIAAVIHDGFDPVAVNRAIDDERITVVSVVAVMLRRMLDARGDRPFPPSLRCVLVGGGPVPRALLERSAALGAPVVQTYGLTEAASQVATLAPEDALRKTGSAGRALYPNRVRIAGADGDATPGEPGEILVSGPVVTSGYLNDANATTRAIIDGWLHTGDIGCIDADGYLHVLDRRDDLIITGGENVYPAEVEAALASFPGVAEAGVIGVADETWGQRVLAIVRLDASSGAKGDVLRDHCRTLLAGYKVPSEIRIVNDPLPRTASGKLQRRVLSAREGSSTSP
jgi:O-succinylbenzoic acid--CoA ligase